ncbi:hypothetical protein NDU88_002622 [Pleurodeles waltl]|uniref:Uncharacterized protein n=1 Tax=Pleurodeles waltl TaxID=8319 RepID=A0AAV7T2X3_PLEWA|nr:hypothetical protein NDU88_002622 [Pleurodeles waltl]
MIEFPRVTFVCVTSLCSDLKKNEGENTRSPESEHAQKEDANSNEKEGNDRRGTTGDSASRDKEEASGVTFWKRQTKQKATVEVP